MITVRLKIDMPAFSASASSVAPSTFSNVIITIQLSFFVCIRMSCFWFGRIARDLMWANRDPIRI